MEEESYIPDRVGAYINVSGKKRIIHEKIKKARYIKIQGLSKRDIFERL